MRGPLFAVVVLCAIATLACGGKGGSASSDFSAQEVLSRAATKFDSLKTFHFKLGHEKGSTQIPLGLRLVEAEGDVALPDRLAAEVQAKQGTITLRVQVVGIGDRTWITNPFTRQFQRLPGDSSISDVLDPAALVSVVARNMRNPQFQGSESVDGTDSYRIKGTVSSDALADALAFAEPGRTLDVEAWVGKTDFLVRRARLKGPLGPDEASDIVRDLTLSKFDSPVTIEEPR